MTTLDATVKFLKTAIIRFLQLNPEANFAKTLKDALKSYNSKFNNQIGGRPVDLNSGYYGKVFSPIVAHPAKNRFFSHHRSYSKKTSLQKFSENFAIY